MVVGGGYGGIIIERQRREKRETSDQKDHWWGFESKSDLKSHWDSCLGANFFATFFNHKLP